MEEAENNGLNMVFPGEKYLCVTAPLEFRIQYLNMNFEHHYSFIFIVNIVLD